jgi:hypothetical protein
MVLTGLAIAAEEFERRSGWSLKPEGLCKGEVCIAFPDVSGPLLDVRLLAERLKMPLAHDPKHEVWCLGPESEGKVLDPPRAPELELPDWRGETFALRSLRGQKVVLVAWASW